ncbi:MAG: RagB/SusD family nutrient uptake outer membrane protein [Lacibacter sp.]
MKQQIFKTILIVALPLMFIGNMGCKKFLDRKPLQATLEDLGQGGLEGLAFGLYSAFTDRNGSYHAFNSIPYFAIHCFRDDDSRLGSDNVEASDWKSIYDAFEYNKQHWSTQIYWEQTYNLIYKSNTLLQFADSLQLNDAPSKVNIAEAKFFRAMAYFNLVRSFGSVPKITNRIYTPNDAKKAKSTVAEIYALIDEDLNYAIANLPDNWLNSAGNNLYPGRLVKYTAVGLAAKTKLYRQDWNGALGLCKQVISSGKYSLLGNYATNFMVAGENGTESLYEVQAANDAKSVINTGYEFGVEQGMRGSGDWDLGWGWNVPISNLVNDYESGDKRKNASILFAGQDDGYGKTVPSYPAVSVQPYWNRKVYPEPSMQTSTGNRTNKWLNHVLIRYADILLMAAEAANEIGGASNNTDATTWINLVRNRAGLGNITYTTQAVMRTAIKKERRFEFALEGERFFDLVRWGDAVSILGPAGYSEPCEKYLPLPQSAIDFAGGVLVQNPCY